METINATHQFGLPSKNIFSDAVQQQYDDTCAIKSQELILHSAGIHMTEDDLIQEAISNGWYTPGEGTSMEDVGKLLELHGLDISQLHNASMFHLVNELEKGHPVIVGVDSGELWNPGVNEKFEDIFSGQMPDHALIVSGLEFNDDFSSGTINIIDPGCGDYCKEYDLDVFQDSWKDSENFMISVV